MKMIQSVFVWKSATASNFELLVLLGESWLSKIGETQPEDVRRCSRLDKDTTRLWCCWCCWCWREQHWNSAIFSRWQNLRGFKGQEILANLKNKIFKNSNDFFGFKCTIFKNCSAPKNRDNILLDLKYGGGTIGTPLLRDVLHVMIQNSWFSNQESMCTY